MDSDKTGTCDVIGESDNASESQALSITSIYYPLNSVKIMFVSKSNGICATPESLGALAITGFVFLCIAGFLILVAIGIVFYMYMQRRKDNDFYESSNLIIDQPQTVTGEGNLELSAKINEIPTIEEVIRPSDSYSNNINSINNVNSDFQVDAPYSNNVRSSSVNKNCSYGNFIKLINK